jgi:MscS family membrane protein
MTSRIFTLLFLMSLLLPPVFSQRAYTPQSSADAPATIQTEETKGIEPSQSEISVKQEEAKWRFTMGKVFWSIVVFLIALIAIRYITRFLVSIAERWIKFRLTVKGVIPIIRIFGWTTVIYIIIAGILSPPIETIIAVTASAGIAVGFASQDILKNIFGGIMILFDRPFQVGDKIQVGNHYGEVVSIGLRTVRIVTPDDSLVSIPNSEIVNQSVSNANSGESNCQVVAEFYLPPDINIDRTKLIAYRAAAVSRYVYLNKPVRVILKNEIHEGKSLIKMRVKAYVFDIRFEFPFMSEMTETIITELLTSKILSPEQLQYLND